MPAVISHTLLASVSLAKVRRLYDIANVLTSLGLIKKVHVREEWGRKPAFQWIGPVDFTNADGKELIEESLHDVSCLIWAIIRGNHGVHVWRYP